MRLLVKPGSESGPVRKADLRCILVTIAVALALWLVASPAPADPPLGVNGDADWVNLVNGLSGWTNLAGNPASEDANGWPTVDVTFNPFDERRNMPWNGPDPTAANFDMSGVYQVSFSGKATITGSTEDGTPVGVQNQVYNAATNTTTLQVVIPASRFLMSLTFKNTQRTATSGTNTGFTNLRIIRPGYPANTTEIFTRASCNIYGAGFSANRFIGPDGVNSYQNFSGSSLINVQWADRPKVTDAYQSGTVAENNNAAPGHQGHGWAWEYMILLANRTHTDMWINIPAGATDDYVTQLAKLLKSGNQYTKGLESGLHIYIEYSNEVWNFGFPQYTWNSVAAKNEVAQGSSPLNNDGTTDPGTWSFRRYGERIYQISGLFKQVFGAAAINTTIRPVFLWQYDTEYQPSNGGPGFWGPSVESVLRWMNKSFGSPKSYLYGIGEAPYYGANDTSSVNSIFNTMWTNSDQNRPRYIAWQALAAFYGLKQVGYESGPSLDAGTGGQATRDPRMTASEYHHFIDNWFAVGGDQVNFFALRGSVSPWGDWLLVEDFRYPNTAKMAGAQAILSAPDPPLTAGNMLPSTPKQSVDIDASQWEQSGYAPGTAENVSIPAHQAYLLRVGSKGSYTVALYGKQDNSGIQEQILVDNKALAVTSMPTKNPGLSGAGSVTLEPGQHTLQINYVYAAGTSSGQAEPTSVRVTLSSGGGTALVPSAPANLTVTSVSSGLANLTWAVTITATGYRVYRSVASGTGYKLVSKPAANSYQDTGLTNGITYYYVVSATNAAGESAVSPQVQAVPTHPNAPAAPTSLTALLAANGVVSIHWTGNSDSVSYNIYRSTTSGSGYSMVASQLGTTFTDGNGGPLNGGGLTDGKPYYYVVTAVNTYGEGAGSAQLAVTPVDAKPEVPASLTAVPSAGRVQLQWMPAASLSPQFWPMQYTVYRATSASGPFTAIINVSVTSALDTGLTDGTTYYYTVTANNSVGSSASSNMVSATPTAKGVISINAGGSAVTGFVADTDFTGGTVVSTKSAITTSLLDHTVPQALYQTAREAATGSSLSYKLTGFAPNGAYTIALHFAEIDPGVTRSGQRQFNVLINGGVYLENFDIFLAAGARNTAIEELIPVVADDTGALVVEFEPGAAGRPLVNGIEIY